MFYIPKLIGPYQDLGQQSLAPQAVIGLGADLECGRLSLSKDRLGCYDLSFVLEAGGELDATSSIYHSIYFIVAYLTLKR